MFPGEMAILSFATNNYTELIAFFRMVNGSKLQKKGQKLGGFGQFWHGPISPLFSNIQPRCLLWRSSNLN
jgi:hypothetical protein